MRTSTILEWSPRVLLVAFALFISVFALDVFDTHLGLWQTAGALFLHLLPTLLLLLVVALAWRRSWLGGLVCLGLAVALRGHGGAPLPLVGRGHDLRPPAAHGAAVPGVLDGAEAAAAG